MDRTHPFPTFPLGFNRWKNNEETTFILGKCHAICATGWKSDFLIWSVLCLNPHPLDTMPNLRQRVFINHAAFSVVLTSSPIKDSLKKQPAALPAHLEFSFVQPRCQAACCVCVLSNCIAGDIMIEHRLPKLIEACQSQHKLCSKCCSAACEKVTAPEPEQALQSM